LALERKRPFWRAQSWFFPPWELYHAATEWDKVTKHLRMPFLLGVIQNF
jgi:hypothetical protein